MTAHLVYTKWNETRLQRTYVVYKNNYVYTLERDVQEHHEQGIRGG